MGYLIGQVLLCLAAAALAGSAIGWLLRSLGTRHRIDRIESEWRGRNHRLERQRDDALRSRDDIGLRLSTVEAEKTAFQAERNSAESIAATSRAELDSYRKRYASLESEIAGYRDELETLGEARTAAGKAEAEIAAARGLRDGLETQLIDARARTVELEEEIDSRDHEIGKLERRLADADDGRTAAEASLAAERRAQSDLARRIVALQTGRDTLEAELAESRAHLASAQGAIVKARDQFSQLQGQADEMSHQQRQLAESSMRGEALADRVRELEARIASEVAGAAALRDELAKRRSTAAELERRLNTKSGDEQRLEELEGQLSDLDRDIERLRGERDALRAEHQRCGETIAALHDRVAELEGEAEIGSTREVGSPVPTGRPDWLLAEPQGDRDDLKQIHGVGPVLEHTMNELGIYHFRQIALWRRDDIEWVSAHINAFPDRIERDGWIEQATRLHREKYTDPV